MSAFAYERIWRETSECFRPSCVMACVGEVFGTSHEPPTAVVAVAFDGCFFERAVHSFDPSIRPRPLDLRQTVLNAVFIGRRVAFVNQRTFLPATDQSTALGRPIKRRSFSRADKFNFVDLRIVIYKIVYAIHNFLNKALS